ncbi:MAG TPA: HemK/PrmC family methyltransferase [Ramlibacter sp.]|uniref:HemK/PrmC family methyltransferase n=1 Tax=Ramlibacter sp. TaxID=1917967 RepID=UPI002CD2681D|nr:HemK/PrmC family methyltransferase [Ramlibacter sp.]HVZ43312.1 HemK/PrmC family methyltransferase [Ramlibacter sp.]
MKISEAIRAAEATGLARLDAQLLLLHVLGRNPHDRAWLAAHDMDPLSAVHEGAFLMLCRRRHAGEPAAYLVGTKEFHGLELHVDARVLVPRPDTEVLVDWALELLGAAPAQGAMPHPGARPVIPAKAGIQSVETGNALDSRFRGNDGRAAGEDRRDAVRIVDLGTGSGAIALAIKKSCPFARVEAVDASLAALEVAAANARRLHLDVDFRHASWLGGCEERYDLIVSNPPYVAENDPHLAALAHEPQDALRSGPDGLDDIRQIVAQAPARLKPGGWLLLEHGWDQAGRVRALLAAAGLGRVQSRRDLSGIERATGGQLIELG